MTENKPEENIPPADPVLDMDDLLGADPAAEAPTETDAQRRIRELQAALDAPMPEPSDPVYKPAAELTDEERQIRDLEDRLAQRRAKEAEERGVTYADQEEGETLLIHFLTDGFTFGGQSWYRGQEVEFVIGSEAYEQTKDRNGKTWLDLVDDIDAQYKRWGTQVIARGPWRGRQWDDFSHLSDPDEVKAAQAAAEAERRRSRRAPVIR